MAKVDLKIQEAEEVSALLDTIEGGSKARIKKIKRQLVGGINMYTSTMPRGPMADLMETEPLRLLE